MKIINNISCIYIELAVSLAGATEEKEKTRIITMLTLYIQGRQSSNNGAGARKGKTMVSLLENLSDAAKTYPTHSEGVSRFSQMGYNIQRYVGGRSSWKR